MIVPIALHYPLYRWTFKRYYKIIQVHHLETSIKIALGYNGAFNLITFGLPILSINSLLKQEAYELYCSPEKHFQSINTFTFA